MQRNKDDKFMMYIGLSNSNVIDYIKKDWNDSRQSQVFQCSLRLHMKASIYLKRMHYCETQAFTADTSK